MILALLWVAHAQNTPSPAADSYSATKVELIPGVLPGPPPPTHQVDDMARDLGRKLRCPVCQGANITDSPSETARAMFERTRQLIAAGYSDQQIIDYFVEKYTEFVLLDPQSDGANAMLYLGPGLGVGFGIAIALWAALSWRREDDVPIAARPQSPDTLDDYERRLLAELNPDD